MGHFIRRAGRPAGWAKLQVRALLFLAILAFPHQAGAQASQGPKVVDKGGRLSYDDTPAPAGPTPMGQAKAWQWAAALSGIVVLGGGVLWAARRSKPQP